MGALIRSVRATCLNSRVSDNVIASVRFTCASCGTVEVPVGAVRLVMARPDLDGDPRNLVEFACPACGTTCSLRADERTTRLLIAAGITLVTTYFADLPHTSFREGPEAR